MSIRRAIVSPNKRVVLDKKLAKIGVDKITCFHVPPYGCTIVMNKKIFEQGNAGFYLLKNIRLEAASSGCNPFKRVVERLHKIGGVPFGYAFCDPHENFNMKFGIRVAMERLLYAECQV